MLRCAMRKGDIASTGPRLDLVGPVLTLSVLIPHHWVVSLFVIVCMGKPATRHRAALEMVVVPRATKQALLAGYTP